MSEQPFDCSLILYKLSAFVCRRKRKSGGWNAHACGEWAIFGCICAAILNIEGGKKPPTRIHILFGCFLILYFISVISYFRNLRIWVCICLANNLTFIRKQKKNLFAYSFRILSVRCLSFICSTEIESLINGNKSMKRRKKKFTNLT